eukprot:4644299-Amphidinium_carterae.1
MCIRDRACTASITWVNDGAFARDGVEAPGAALLLTGHRRCKRCGQGTLGSRPGRQTSNHKTLL